MPAPDLILFSRRTVTPDCVAPAAVTIRDGLIAHITPAASPPPGATDLGDHALIPGIVDTHVHINEPGRTDWEGFATAGRAAAAGGITTLVVMPLNCDPVATTPAALNLERAAAAAACIVDFGFWGGIIPGNTDQLAPLWHAGALGFKCFMVHSGIDSFPNITEADLDLALPILAALSPTRDIPLLAHAEDPATIAAALPTSGLLDHPRAYARYLASRPPSAESAAIHTLIRLADRHRARIHIVHLAAADPLPALRAARARGFPITVETCPHYLALAAEDIPDGATIFKCAPPIRTRDHQSALWSALADRDIDLIASDHSPCPPALRLLDTGDFLRAWGGISSLQLALPVVWTHAAPRHHTLADLARWMSEQPAALAGLTARKGRIAPGADADLIVFDPDAEFTVHAADLAHRHKPTPYDGHRLRGRVVRTYLRGRVVFDADRPADLHTQEPHGQWLTRTPTPPPPARLPAPPSPT